MTEKKKQIRTIHDIARVAGVSATTVSFVLNKKGNINVKTRERVMEIVEQSNYQPSKIAQQLRKKRTNSFGVVIDHFHNRFFNSVFDGINSIADPNGYSFLVSESKENFEKEKRETLLLIEHGVDGLILFPCRDNYTHLLELHTQFSVPVVLIGNTYSKKLFPSVTADNLQGARLATKKLIALNRKPILHIAGPSTQSMCTKRKINFIETLKKEGKEPNPEKFVFETYDLSIGEGYSAMERISAEFSPPFSIFVVNDDTAMGVIKFCNRNNLAIPQDVALIGFSDVDLIDELDLGLSSIHIPAEEMGSRAAQLLLECIISEPPSCNPKEFKLPVELIERRSTDIF